MGGSGVGSTEIQFRLHQGTVIPSQASLYIVADLKSFRTMVSSRDKQRARFVSGPLSGRFAHRTSNVSVTLHNNVNQPGIEI